jgi:hypothetical protein
MPAASRVALVLSVDEIADGNGVGDERHAAVYSGFCSSSRDDVVHRLGIVSQGLGVHRAAGLFMRMARTLRAMAIPQWTSPLEHSESLTLALS